MNGSELVARHPERWRAATKHPFLEGVRDGSLPRIAFQTWLAQDYLFVFDLLRFQARLLSIAPRAAEHALAAGLVALEAELSWFDGQAKRHRLPLASERHPVTDAYRQRLWSWAEAWKPGITALWTAERAYLESWSWVAPGAPAYREFVEHWTHPDFAAYVQDLERLVDSGGPDAGAFVTICGFERDFWEMAWSSARA